MADESMDVENFTSSGNEVIDVDGGVTPLTSAGGSGGGYVDDDIDIDDDDDDDDEEEDDDAPLLAPSKINMINKQRQQQKQQQNNNINKIKKSRQMINKKPINKAVNIDDDYKPGDYKLRACGVSSELKEFIIAKFRDGLPEFNELKDTNELLNVVLFRDGERSLEKRKEGLRLDRRYLNFMHSNRGQRTEVRRSKQGLTTIRERLLKDWKLEIAPKTVRDKLVIEHESRIQRRLNSGLTKGMPLDHNDKDVDEEEDDDDDDDEEDEEKDDKNDKDDNNNEKEGRMKDQILGNENEENEEVTLKELKKLVKKYTGQFDGRTSASKFAFMVMNEDTKMVDVIPVSDTSMFVFRSDQKATAKTAEQVEKIHRKLKNKRLKDSRLKHFAESAFVKQTEREILLGDRTHIENIPNSYNAGIKASSNIQITEDDLGEDFDYEKEFDNNDVYLYDRDSGVKEDISVPIDENKQDSDLQKFLVNTIPDDDEEDTDKDKGKDKDKAKEENKEDIKQDTKSVKEETVTVKQQPTTIRKSVKQSPVTISPSIITSPSPGSGSNQNNRGRHSSPSGSGSNRRTPQISDVKHLLPPPGVLPTADHVRAVLKEVLKGKNEMDFKKSMKYFDKKTPEQKRNLINLIKQVADFRKDTTSGNLVISLKPQ